MQDSTAGGDYSEDTSESLLWNLRDSTHRTRFERAWDEFYRRYSEPMYRRCRKKGLQHEDAEELVQDLMVRLMRELKRFTYDPNASFRGWLQTVTTRAVIDLFRSRHPMLSNMGSQLDEFFSPVSVEEEVMRMFDQEILREVKTQVKSELVQTPTGLRNWEIYVKVVEQDQPAAMVADEYGISCQLVYVVRHRVVNRLKEAVKAISGE